MGSLKFKERLAGHLLVSGRGSSGIRPLRGHANAVMPMHWKTGGNTKGFPFRCRTISQTSPLFMSN